MTSQKHKIDTSNIIVSDDSPYINLDSPYIREQISNLSTILTLPKVLENVRLLLNKP
jgi:hypothetical protein